MSINMWLNIMGIFLSSPLHPFPIHSSVGIGWESIVKIVSKLWKYIFYEKLFSSLLLWYKLKDIFIFHSFLLFLSIFAINWEMRWKPHRCLSHWMKTSFNQQIVSFIFKSIVKTWDQLKTNQMKTHLN